MMKCELMGQTKITVGVNIYDKCLERGFGAIYEQAFEKLKV